jgi:hypothetical protein
MKKPMYYEHTRANGPLALGLGPKINELMYHEISFATVVTLTLVVDPGKD